MSAHWLGTADPDAARQMARDILSDPRYHPRRDPRPFAGFFQRLGELVVDPVIRFLRGIGDLLPSVGTAPWLLLAAAVVIVATVGTVKLSSGRSRQRFGAARSAHDEDGLDPEELERRAEEAEGRGELEAALRLRFRAGLLRLHDAGVVRLRPGLTNSAVRRVLRSSRFDELAGDFDEVAYGGRPATTAQLATARTAWPALVEDARSGAGARR